MIHEAGRGHAEHVVAALASGVGSIKRSLLYMNHAVRLAARNDHVAVVQILLEWVGPYGSRVDPTEFCNRALQYAAEGGHVDVVRLLLRWVGSGNLKGKCIDPDACYHDSPLWYAARNNHAEVIRVLLDWVGQGKLKGRRLDPNGFSRSVIQIAVHSGHVEAVRVYLDWVGKGVLEGKRVDPTEANNLMVREAALNGNAEIVRVLLEWVGQGSLEGKRVDLERVGHKLEKYAQRKEITPLVLAVYREIAIARAEWMHLRASWIAAVVRGRFARQARGVRGVLPGRRVRPRKVQCFFFALQRNDKGHMVGPVVTRIPRPTNAGRMWYGQAHTRHPAYKHVVQCQGRVHFTGQASGAHG